MILNQRFRYGKLFLIVFPTLVFAFLIFTDNYIFAFNGRHFNYGIEFSEPNGPQRTKNRKGTRLRDIGNNNSGQTLDGSKSPTVIVSNFSLHGDRKSKFLACRERNVTLSQKPLPLTGLVSFPGSGNTWVRHLIQQMTGMATSSVYCDPNLERQGFAYECSKQLDRAIVVKTHQPLDIEKFDRVILIIRNPYEAILSLMNFLVAGHTGIASRKNIKTVYRFLPQYEAIYRELIQRAVAVAERRPVYILQYEALREDMTTELRRLADFLDASVTDADISCTAELQEGLFHRNSSYEARLGSLQNIFTHDVMASMVRMVGHCETLLERKFHKKIIIGGHIQDILIKLNEDRKRAQDNEKDDKIKRMKNRTQ